jgi:hypothetical protein
MPCLLAQELGVPMDAGQLVRLSVPGLAEPGRATPLAMELRLVQLLDRTPTMSARVLMELLCNQAARGLSKPPDADIDSAITNICRWHLCSGAQGDSRGCERLRAGCWIILVSVSASFRNRECSMWTLSIFRIGALDKNRVEAFSDGVIAVAIALLALEFTVPSGLHDEREVWDAIVHLLPSLAAWIVSFAFILMFWVNHHFFSNLRHAGTSRTPDSLAAMFNFLK